MQKTYRNFALALSLCTLSQVAVGGWDEGNAAYQSKDYTTALRELLPLATGGNAMAQYLVADMYLQGSGVVRDEAQAAKWFSQSAEQGHVPSMKPLARLLFQGRGLEQNLRESAQWFRNARKGHLQTDPLVKAEEDESLPVLDIRLQKGRCKMVQPDYPVLAARHGLGGRVFAQALLVDGELEDVVIVSGPRVFHEEVRSAMLAYQCKATLAQEEALATQEFVFDVADAPRTREFVLEQLSPVYWSSSPSFHANWEGLSAEQKLAVRAQYINLLPNEEPPYPKEGMGGLIENIRLQAQHLGVEGSVVLDARIDASGAVETVNVLDAPTAEMGQYAAAVLFNTQYKPARCDGKPCAMSLPIDIVITALRQGMRFKEAKALDRLHSAARGGDSRAQNDLGERYEYARGVKKDLNVALSWYQQSANQGYANAQNNLGRMYEAGKAVEKNLAVAADWYRKSAEQNYAPAQSNYGYMLAYGDGVEKNLTESVRWYQKSADQGYAPGINNLGSAYKTGRGVPQDLAKAVSLFEQAANRRHALGQKNLALAYGSGEGVKQDLVQFVYWAKQAAASGNTNGQILLAAAYTFGLGVPMDLSAAAHWFRRAAEKGDRLGQAGLAEAYLLGWGVAQDDALAFKWLQQSAQQGSRTAMYHLFTLYRDGRGVAQDLSQASGWLLQAAKRGSTEAQFDLAKAYETGTGFERNTVAAKEWADKAKASLQDDVKMTRTPGMAKTVFDHCSTNPTAASTEPCKRELKQYLPRE